MSLKLSDTRVYAPQIRARLGTTAHFRSELGENGTAERETAHRRRLHPAGEREFFIDNLLVRLHFIIVMIRRTGLAPWEFECPFPDSLAYTFLLVSIHVYRSPMLVSTALAMRLATPRIFFSSLLLSSLELSAINVFEP